MAHTTKLLAVLVAAVFFALVVLAAFAPSAEAHWQVRARYCKAGSAHCHILHR